MVSNIFKVLKGKKTCQPRSLCPANISFKNKGELKVFLDIQKLKGLISSRSTLQKNVKGLSCQNPCSEEFFLSSYITNSKEFRLMPSHLFEDKKLISCHLYFFVFLFWSIFQKHKSCPSFLDTLQWLPLSPRTGQHSSAQPPRAHLIQSHYVPLSSRLTTMPAHKPPHRFSKMGKSLLPQNFPEHFPHSIPFLWFSHSILPSSAQLPLPQEDPPRPPYLKQQHPSLSSHSSYPELELFTCLLAHLLADFSPSLVVQRAETSSFESWWYLQSPVPCPAHRW